MSHKAQITKKKVICGYITSSEHKVNLEASPQGLHNHVTRLNKENYSSIMFMNKDAKVLNNSMS